MQPSMSPFPSQLCVYSHHYYRKRSFLSLCSQQATIIGLYTGFGDSINHKHCHQLHSGHRLRQSPATPTWSQASAQTVDIHMVCNNHMDQEHHTDSVCCRTSDVVRALGCKHRPWDSNLVSESYAGHSHQHSPLRQQIPRK